MNEIDLIPSDYRSQRWQTRALKMFAIGCSVIVATTVLGAGVLTHSTTRIQRQATELEARRDVTGQRRAELEALSGRQVELEQQLAALEGRLDPAPAAAELDVAELLRIDGVHHNQPPFKPVRTSLG